MPLSEGALKRHDAFSSAYVEARPIDVWLPPGYSADEEMRYPVLYLHDGQNLFDPELSFSGEAWGIDEALTRLIRTDPFGGAIAVGIWNTPQRIPEYMPQKPLEAAEGVRPLRQFAQTYGEAPFSDRYLRFLVEELKPFIDRTYRTRPERAHTLLMGSSMGGLISLYGLCEYPEVFGAAACLSTSWTVAGRVMIPYLKDHLPPPQTHRIYFDYGVEAHIGAYETYQKRVNLLLSAAGYLRGWNWRTERFPGAEHSESAWRKRVDIPLRFLLTAPTSRTRLPQPEAVSSPRFKVQGSK